jgi:hypothetical protein
LIESCKVALAGVRPSATLSAASETSLCMCMDPGGIIPSSGTLDGFCDVVMLGGVG